MQNVYCGKHLITILQENATQADRGTEHWPRACYGRRRNEAIYDYEEYGFHTIDFYSQ
jgi:hypothetical protein